MPTANRHSLASTLSLAAVIASIFAFAPVSNAQTVPGVSIVSQDATIVPEATIKFAPNSYLGGTPTLSTATLATSDPTFLTAPSASQYFANGATLPATVLRKLLDFYGVAIPNTAPNILQIGSQGFQPFNSPRNNFSQYNYCGTGSGNGRATFTGTAVASVSCSYITGVGSLVTPAAGTPLPGTRGASPGAPVGNVGPATPPVGSNFAYAAYPTFPFGAPASGSQATAAPLFTFADATASTSALTSTDLANYTTNKLPTRGNPVQVPVFFGAISPILQAPSTNAPLAASPRVSSSDLCKIFDGQITNFNQLTAPSSTTFSGLINLVVRQDSSSTTTAFKSYLAAVCNSVNATANLPVVTPGFTTYYITAGTTAFPTVTTAPSSTFVRRNGKDGVGDYVATTTGGFGYVESAFAQPVALNAPSTTTAPAPIQVQLQIPVTVTPTNPTGNFTRALLSTVRNAVNNVTLVANSTYTCVLTVSGLPVVGTMPNAYPIVTQTYALAYSRYPSLAERDAVRNLFAFILGSITTPTQANDQIAGQAGFPILTTGATNMPIVVQSLPRTRARGCIVNSVITPTLTQP
jgi:ABC-type phosphate transport system substrate-binding protein